MNRRFTTVERAYQLAGSGECANVGEVKDRLRQEGFTDIAGQLYGPTITAALRKLCTGAYVPPVPEPEAAAPAEPAAALRVPDTALTSTRPRV